MSILTEVEKLGTAIGQEIEKLTPELKLNAKEFSSYIQDTVEAIFAKAKAGVEPFETLKTRVSKDVDETKHLIAVEVNYVHEGVSYIVNLLHNVVDNTTSLVHLSSPILTEVKTEAENVVNAASGIISGTELSTPSDPNDEMLFATMENEMSNTAILPSFATSSAFMVDVRVNSGTTPASTFALQSSKALIKDGILTLDYHPTDDIIDWAHADHLSITAVNRAGKAITKIGYDVAYNTTSKPEASFDSNNPAEPLFISGLTFDVKNTYLEPLQAETDSVTDTAKAA